MEFGLIINEAETASCRSGENYDAMPTKFKEKFPSAAPDTPPQYQDPLKGLGNFVEVRLKIVSECN